eukprot:TRINITY_DN27047_c0_g2_i1.p1 TRINITY_DN27047_c0_g2~~TRINITY_DN27047_c0_g2_i1.p1  ORF type:complete len:335 (-),score=73.03 TRINITY_DN27047_c0_g2_i1:71-991(-)
MRRNTFARGPDFSKKDDPTLCRQHGTPDVLISVGGHKLYAHSKVLRVFSKTVAGMLSDPDPFYGKQIFIRSWPGQPRSREGVVGLLNAIYSPQLLPPPELSSEIYGIAREFGMELLLERLKIGLAKNCDLDTLRRAEQDLAEWSPEDVEKNFPRVVFDAFAEFSVDELHALPGYAELSERTRLEIAERRVLLLERHLAGSNFNACRAAHTELFRDCPAELRAEGFSDASKEATASTRTSFAATVSGATVWSPAAARDVGAAATGSPKRPQSAGSIAGTRRGTVTSLSASTTLPRASGPAALRAKAA